jgi:N-hydroxyarylamine O-acetyltransferase
MCLYQQTSPQSHFTQRSVCSLATAEGRKTLSDGRYIVTTAEGRSERAVGDEAEYYAILLEEFNIRLPAETPLLAPI